MRTTEAPVPMVQESIIIDGMDYTRQEAREIFLGLKAIFEPESATSSPTPSPAPELAPMPNLPKAYDVLPLPPGAIPAPPASPTPLIPPGFFKRHPLTPPNLNPLDPQFPWPNNPIVSLAVDLANGKLSQG